MVPAVFAVSQDGRGWFLQYWLCLRMVEDGSCSIGCVSGWWRMVPAVLAVSQDGGGWFLQYWLRLRMVEDGSCSIGCVSGWWRMVPAVLAASQDGSRCPICNEVMDSLNDHQIDYRDNRDPIHCHDAIGDAIFSMLLLSQEENPHSY